MQKILISLAFISITSLTNAQTMYKCGNTYSQNPCGLDEEKIETTGVIQPSTTQADPEKSYAMKKECVDWVTNVPKWKDNNNIRIGSINRGNKETRSIEGRTQIVWPYHVMVSGQNSYGRNLGEKPFICFANQDETKIIHLQLR